MYKSLGFFLAAATLSAANAQYPDPASQSSSPAPIVQSYQGQQSPDTQNNRAVAQSAQLFETQPAAGVYVRGDVPNGVQTVTSSGPVTELRIVQGRADITLHHPTDHSEILIDLPGGQVSLLKDGLYTFNAQTNTIRVLHGEAEVGGLNGEKSTKVKETQQLAFFPGARPKAVNAYSYELTADLLQDDNHGDGLGRGGYDEGFYGGSPYAYGFSPYGFYPYGGYGFGYPVGIGLGFGYGGGFYRGGGYGGGFHGGGFHGGRR